MDLGLAAPTRRTGAHSTTCAMVRAMARDVLAVIVMLLLGADIVRMLLSDD